MVNQRGAAFKQLDDHMPCMTGQHPVCEKGLGIAKDRFYPAPLCEQLPMAMILEGGIIENVEPR
jgi:hypothetical protein